MSDEREFYVEWRINVTATSACEAAEQARHYQTKPDTTAVVFHVREMSSENNFTVVDLIGGTDDID